MSIELPKTQEQIEEENIVEFESSLELAIQAARRNGLDDEDIREWLESKLINFPN